MKILIKEDEVQKLHGLINRLGIAKVTKMLGGFQNVGKILGENSPQYVIAYLDENWYPDYGWLTPEEYKDEVERWGNIAFEVNDENAYQFSEHNDGSTKLYTFGRFYNKVEEIFGENDEWWNPIIKQWFEERTGLKVTWIE